jgi:hypothetical protein
MVDKMVRCMVVNLVEQMGNLMALHLDSISVALKVVKLVDLIRVYLVSVNLQALLVLR